MIKRLKIIFLSCFVLLNVILFFPIKAEAKTLQDVYNNLDKLEADIKNNQQSQNLTEEEIKNTNQEIKNISQEVINIENSIIASKAKMVELDKNIETKKEEINETLRYFQMSQGESEYLEYIFGAEDITDFINRNAVVERLTSYNKEMIEKMKNWIEEEKQLQIDLKNQQISLDKKQIELKDEVVKLAGKKDKLEGEEITIQEEIDITRKMIKSYEAAGCKLSDDVDICAAKYLPADTKFWRPLAKGYVTSEWSLWRCYNGTCKPHRGIDLGVARISSTPLNTPILAAAAGKVSAVKWLSGGGNTVFINHNVNGQTFTTAYLHLNAVYVSVGQTVTKETVIGGMGATGGDYAVHLHFSLMYGITASISESLNPRQFVNFPALNTTFYDRITKY